jgi:hypothetical protein
MRPSPGLVLAVILVVILTQVVRVVLPGRGPYLWTLLLSAAGLVAGEVLAASGHLNAPTVGVLHPLADVLVIALLQGAGALVAGRSRAA